MEQDNQKHVTPNPNTKRPVENNPLAKGLNVTVSIPESVDIKLVNASALTDFEIWLYISSLLSNVVVGFWVAFVQNQEPKVEQLLLAICIVFSLFFVVSLIVTIFKRRQLSKKSKKYSIQN